MTIPQITFKVIKTYSISFCHVSLKEGVPNPEQGWWPENPSNPSVATSPPPTTLGYRCARAHAQLLAWVLRSRLRYASLCSKHFYPESSLSPSFIRHSINYSAGILKCVLIKLKSIHYPYSDKCTIVSKRNITKYH